MQYMAYDVWQSQFIKAWRIQQEKNMSSFKIYAVMLEVVSAVMLWKNAMLFQDYKPDVWS